MSAIDIDDIKPEVGLNEALPTFTNIQSIKDGQKYRHEIAKVMESQAQFWIADEFAAMLDRDTAKIVAYNLQKHARWLERGVVVATTHTDLFKDLSQAFI